MKKNDVILAAAFLALALAAYGAVALYSASGEKGGEAVVFLDGEEYGRYPLEKDATVEVSLPDGRRNVLKIADGKADMTEATCPDKICVNHRPIGKTGESLICLPNRVVVEIQGGEGMEVDGSTH